MITNELLPG